MEDIKTTNQKNMTIFESTKYDLFNRVTGNREVREEKVKALVDAVQKCNMLCVCPVIITKDYFLLDGQHRIEAAKRLGVPYYYVIAPDHIQKTRMIDLNVTQNSWTIADYIKYFAENGDENYIKLIQFCKKNGVGFALAIAFLGCPRRNLKRVVMDKQFNFDEALVPKAEEKIERYRTLLNDIIYLGEKAIYNVIASFSFLEAIANYECKGTMKELFEKLFKNRFIIKYSQGFRVYLHQIQAIDESNEEVTT